MLPQIILTSKWSAEITNVFTGKICVYVYDCILEKSLEEAASETLNISDSNLSEGGIIISIIPRCILTSIYPPILSAIYTLELLFKHGWNAKTRNPALLYLTILLAQKQLRDTAKLLNSILSSKREAQVIVIKWGNKVSKEICMSSLKVIGEPTSCLDYKLIETIYKIKIPNRTRLSSEKRILTKITSNYLSLLH